MNQRSGDESGEQPSPVADDAPALASSALVPSAAVTPETTPTGAGWSRRELLSIVIAVLLGGAATSAWLMRRPDAVLPATTAPAAGPATAPAASSSAPAARAKWSTENVAQWVGNGRRRFAVELQAENSVAVWQRQVRPVLVVRCGARELEVFVFTNSAAKIEPRTDDHTVRITLDDGPEVSERWPDSADHDALFAPDGAAFARQLIGARTLQFGFTPHNASPVAAHFNVAGLDAALGPAANQCGWK